MADILESMGVRSPYFGKSVKKNDGHHYRFAFTNAKQTQSGVVFAGLQGDQPYLVLNFTVLVGKRNFQRDNVVPRRNTGCNLNSWIEAHRFANYCVQIRQAIQFVHRRRVVSETAKLGAELRLALRI